MFRVVERILKIQVDICPYSIHIVCFLLSKLTMLCIVIPSIILDMFHSHNADKSDPEMKSRNTTDGNGKVCIHYHMHSITYYSHPKLERVDSKNCDVPMPPQML